MAQFCFPSSNPQMVADSGLRVIMCVLSALYLAWGLGALRLSEDSLLSLQCPPGLTSTLSLAVVAPTPSAHHSVTQHDSHPSAPLRAFISRHSPALYAAAALPPTLMGDDRNVTVAYASLLTPYQPFWDFGVGLDAALSYANNREGGVHGRKIDVHLMDVSIDDHTQRATRFFGEISQANAVASNAMNLYQGQSFTQRLPKSIPAVVGADTILDLLVDTLADSGVPVFGPATASANYTTSFSLRNRKVLLLHQPLWVETEHLTRYAVRSRTQCRQFAVVKEQRGGLDEALRRFRALVQDFRLPAPIEATVPTDERLHLLPPGVFLDALMAAVDARAQSLGEPSSHHMPQCVLLLANHNVASMTMFDVYNSTLRDRFHFFATSFAAWPTWNITAKLVEFVRTLPSSPLTTEPFRHLHIAQVTADHRSTTSPAARSFRTAMSAFENLQPSERLIVKTPLRSNDTSAFMMAGYLAGRVAIEALRAVPISGFGAAQYTPETVGTALYQRRMAVVDDVVFGPFNAECTGVMTSATGACECNVGGRHVDIALITESGGTSVIVDDASRFESGVAALDVPWSECTPAFATALPIAHALGSGSGRFFSEWERSLLNCSIVDGARLMPVNVTDCSLGRLTPLNIRYSVQAVTGSLAHCPALQEAAENATVLRWASALGGDDIVRLLDEDPPVVSFEEWDRSGRYDVALLPTMADYIDTATAFATARGFFDGPVVFVTESERLAQLAALSVTSHNAACSQCSYVSFDRFEAPRAGVVIVATQNKTDLHRAFSILALRLDLTVVVCTSDFVLQWAVDTLYSGQDLRPYTERIYFVSAFPALVNGSVYSTWGALVAFAQAAVVGRLWQPQTDAAAPMGTAAEVAAALYKYPTLATPLMTLSHFSDHPCNGTAALCQCNKGLSKFYVRQLVQFASTGDNTTSLVLGRAGVVFDHEHQYCGTRYLTDTKTDESDSGLSREVIIGLAAGAAAVAVIVAALIVCLVVTALRASSRQRSNKYAPTDGSRGVTLVFTDIQASTTLWAHAPRHMGAALDAHHALIRDLIKKHKGYEVKTIGDSFMVAFKDPVDGLAFSVAVQTTLFDYDWGTPVLDLVYSNFSQIAAAPVETITDQPHDDTTEGGDQTCSGTGTQPNPIRHHPSGLPHFEHRPHGVSDDSPDASRSPRSPAVDHGAALSGATSDADLHLSIHPGSATAPPSHCDARDEKYSSHDPVVVSSSSSEASGPAEQATVAPMSQGTPAPSLPASARHPVGPSEPSSVPSPRSDPRVVAADSGTPRIAAAGVSATSLTDPDLQSAAWNGLRVRVGMHTGHCSVRYDETTKGYDYYGTMVNTVSRVEGVGNGGQILLTEDALVACQPGLRHRELSSLVITDLGPQILRGTTEPVRLFQAVPARFASRVFPPLRLEKMHDVESESDGHESDAEHKKGSVSPRRHDAALFEYHDPSVAPASSDDTPGGSQNHQMSPRGLPASGLVQLAPTSMTCRPAVSHLQTSPTAAPAPHLPGQVSGLHNHSHSGSGALPAVHSALRSGACPFCAASIAGSSDTDPSRTFGSLHALSRIKEFTDRVASDPDVPLPIRRSPRRPSFGSGQSLSDATGQAMDSTAGAPKGREARDVDHFVERMTRKLHTTVPPGATVAVYRVLDAMLAPSPAADRGRLIRSLAAQWRVPQAAAPWMQRFTTSWARSGGSPLGSSAPGDDPAATADEHRLILETTIRVLRAMEARSSAPLARADTGVPDPRSEKYAVPTPPNGLLGSIARLPSPTRPPLPTRTGHVLPPPLALPASKPN